MSEPLLSIRDLSVEFVTDEGSVRALERISLDVARGEILGIAGESGSGKSTLAQAVLRILPAPGVIVGGQVSFEGQDLLSLTEPQLRALRWSRLAMVFQSAMDSLNPVMIIGEQIADTFRAHQDVAKLDLKAKAAELLALVGIDPMRAHSYPHQLSGGMRQRVGIAIALALDPALVILDEPTTALDVIVERDILQKILELKQRLGFSVMFITHDLARLLQVADRIAVFYAGRLIELASAERIHNAPSHPYTQGLLRSFPRLSHGKALLESIPGSPPSLATPPSGCRFHPRCPKAIPLCSEKEPALLPVGKLHLAACHLADPDPAA